MFLFKLLSDYHQGCLRHLRGLYVCDYIKTRCRQINKEKILDDTIIVICSFTLDLLCRTTWRDMKERMWTRGTLPVPIPLTKVRYQCVMNTAPVIVRSVTVIICNYICASVLRTQFNSLITEKVFLPST